MRAPQEDFSDRWNPFLVKELRQALRGKLVVPWLCWLQLSMGAMAVQSVLGATDSEAVSISDFFMAANCVFSLHLVPALRHSISGDEDAKPEHLELLRMGSHSSGRIVWSKVLTSQALMMLGLISVLPYELIRYFRGFMEVGSELWMLAAFVMTGWAVSVLGVMCGSCKSAPARIFWMGVILLGVPLSDSTMMALSYAMASGSAGMEWITFFVVWVIGFCVLLAGLESRYMVRSEVEYPWPPSPPDSAVAPAQEHR
jgi:hypothetical protein